jgi:AraC family transcriptional regulator, transcriptional activator of pobA
MSSTIRIAHLSTSFVYKTMQEIEAERPAKKSDSLPHRHDFFTIIAVEKAIGTHQIDFKNYDLTPFTLYFISPEQVHHLEISKNTEGGLLGHVIMFTPNFLLKHSILPEKMTKMELFFNCDETKPLVLTTVDMQRLTIFFEKFKTESTTHQKDTWEVLGAWLKLFLLECSRMKSEYQQKNIKLDKRQAEIVRHFKNDVETHFKNWHQVGDYAEVQHLTSNYLNEIIKSETGTSAKDFILNRLILEAKRLARFSDMTAKEIAYALGYEDTAQFSKFFKKCEGITFTTFRDNN